MTAPTAFKPPPFLPPNQQQQYSQQAQQSQPQQPELQPNMATPASQLGNYDLLAKYFTGPHVAGGPPGVTDIAKYILLNAQPIGASNGTAPSSLTQGSATNGPTLIGRVMDLLSRGNYATAEFARHWAETGNPDLGSLWEGFSGKKKTTFSDVIKQMGETNKDSQAGLGLALDVLADPLTYVGPGLIGKLGKLGKGAEAAKVTSEDKSLAQKLVDSGTPTNPESFGLPRTTPQLPPDALKAPPLPPYADETVLNTKTPQAPLMPQAGINTAQGVLPLETSAVNPKTVLNTKAATSTVPSLTGKDLTLPPGLMSGKPELLNPVLKEGELAPKLMPLADTSPSKLAIPESVKNIPTETPGIPKEIPGQLPLNFPKFKVTDIRGQAAKQAEFAATLEEHGASNIIARAAAGDVQAASKLEPAAANVFKPRSRIANAVDRVYDNFNADLSTAQINQKFPETLNAKQQLRLFENSANEARKMTHIKGRPVEEVNAEIDKKTYDIYKSVEDRFVTEQGKVPRIGTGEDVKLSDVASNLAQRGIRPVYDTLKEFGSEIKPGSEVWKSVEGLRARGAIKDGTFVKQFMDNLNTARSNVKATIPMSDGEASAFDKFIKNYSKNTIKETPVSPASQKATKSLINLAIDAGKTNAQLAIERMAKELDEVVAKGKANLQVNEVLTRELDKDLGKMPEWALGTNKASEAVMGRMATWWGQKDIRPLTLDAIGSAQSTAAARGHVLDRMFTGANPVAQKEAFRAAQGLKPALTAESQSLASGIKMLMDNLVGQVSGSSVLLRSGVSMAMLNKWMKHYRVGFEFTNGAKVKDILGAENDFSKGTDWLNSWRVADPKDDAKLFLLKTQQAMEQATREKALFDELGERFGSRLPGNGYNTKVTGYSYIEGYHFPEEIAKQIPRVVKDWSIQSWRPGSPLLKQYDRLLSMWKAGVTLYQPGKRIRDAIGDIYLGWMDGVNTPRPYVLAGRVQMAMKNYTQDLEGIQRLIKTGAMPAKYGAMKPSDVLFRNKSGIPFTAEQIAAVAHQRGLLEEAKNIHDLIDMNTEGKRGILNVKPFGGKVQDFARSVTELQYNNARVAHFIDKVAKSRGSNLGKIFEEAGNRARKWHPSMDLTEFEKKGVRRVIPFYSWIRKSTPLLIEGLVMHPGKVVFPAKLTGAIQTSQGIQTPGRGNQFPTDQMFPEWIRELGVGAFSNQGILGSISNQSVPGYVATGAGLNPLSEFIAQLRHPDKTLAGALSPAIRVPMDLMRGQDTATKESLTGFDARPGALQQYLGEQLPYYSMFQQLTGVTPFGTTTGAVRKGGESAKTEALMNFMTGAGVRGTGPYIPQAKFEKNAEYKAKQAVQKETYLGQARDLGGYAK